MAALITVDLFNTMNFEQAAAKIKDEGKNLDLSNDDLLELYGLYKQAKEGDNTAAAPWAVQFEAKKKWEAWTARKGMSKAVAETTYVQTVEKFLATKKK